MTLFDYPLSLLFGLELAVAIGAIAALAGLDRERSFYAAVVMTVASYYVLFAVVGGSAAALIGEIGMLVLFVLLAVLGFKFSPWLIVFALALHGVLDSIHPVLIDNAGAPPWWPAFCLSYDVGMALWLAGLLLARRRAGRAVPAGAAPATAAAA